MAKNKVYNPAMIFKAILHRLSIDQDGEGTLTVKVPLSDVDSIMELSKHIQEVLKIRVDYER